MKTQTWADRIADLRVNEKEMAYVFLAQAVGTDKDKIVDQIELSRRGETTGMTDLAWSMLMGGQL